MSGENIVFNKSSILSVIILCALTVTTLFGTVGRAQAAAQCSVEAYYLYVRTGPGTQYPITQVYHQDNGFVVFGRNGDASWVSVNNGFGDTPVGWVAARFLKCYINLFTLPITIGPVEQPTCTLPFRLGGQVYARITPGPANSLRTEPGRGYGYVITYIPAGATVQVLEGPKCIGSIYWWRVSYANLQGWTGEGENGTYWMEPISGDPQLPPQTGRTYVVQPGDNLYRIAIRFGVNVWTLAQYNGIYNINSIYAGQRLRIP